MPLYLRPRVTGATVFFTVCLAHRGCDLLVREIDLLREAVRVTKRERPFEIVAWVVLPDHMHCVWRMPAGDRAYGTRWGAIKARFTMAVRAKYGGGTAEPGLRKDKREAAIWQRRFWEHHLRGEEDVARAVEYCWINPVKHGLVERPEDWLL